ncbi:hypothetical protein LCGC14_2270620, partial [marine sediment metagenome]
MALPHTVEVLAPVFGVIALGAVLRKTGFVSAEALKAMRALCYWVGLPCVLFLALASRGFSAEAGQTLLVVVAGMAACIVVCYIGAATVRMPWAQVGSFVHTGYRGNLAFVGLAVIASAYPSGASGESEAQATAALVLGPMVILYNVIAVTVLKIGRERFSAAALGSIVRAILTNPLVIACALGGALSAMGWKLPAVVDKTVGLVGRFAMPLALVCVGGALVSTPIRGRLAWSLLAGAIKVSVGPVAGYLVAMRLGLGGQQLAVAMILLACPTAIASYVLTE